MGSSIVINAAGGDAGEIAHEIIEALNRKPPKKKTATIYALKDGHSYGYVGQTRHHPQVRLHAHMKLATGKDHRPVYKWIREVLREGRSVEIEVIETCSLDEAFIREQFHIVRLICDRQALKNLFIPGTKEDSDGQDGDPSGHLMQELLLQTFAANMAEFLTSVGVPWQTFIPPATDEHMGRLITRMYLVLKAMAFGEKQ